MDGWLSKHAKKGFTLTETMVAVALLGCMAALAVPWYGSLIEDGKKLKAISMLQQMRLAQLRYQDRTGSFADAVWKLELQENLDQLKREFNFSLEKVENNNFCVVASRVEQGLARYTIKMDRSGKHDQFVGNSDTSAGPPAVPGLSDFYCR